MEVFKVASYAFIGIAALCAAANQVMGVWQKATHKLKEDPPPGETYRTRDGCVGIHEKDRQWIRNVETKANAAVSRVEHRLDIDGLHNRIERTQETFTNSEHRLVAAVGRLEGVTASIRKGTA